MSAYVRYPPQIKAKVIQLRQQGYSLKEISDKLQIRKATIWCWVKSVRLSSQAKERIQQKIVEGGKIGRPRALIANRRRLEMRLERIREDGTAIVEGLPLNPVFSQVLCGLLYLCEGAKYPSTQGIRFGNSDPILIRVFILFLRTCFSITESKFRGEIMYRCDQDQDALIRYWSQVTGIPEENFYRRKPDSRTKGMPTKKIGYKGVCVINYLDTDLQLLLLALGEEMLQRVCKNGGAGENRTLTSTMPLSRAPITLQPRSYPV